MPDAAESSAIAFLPRSDRGRNPDADAWKFGYRTVGIADVYENKLAGIYCHAKA